MGDDDVVVMDGLAAPASRGTTGRTGTQRGVLSTSAKLCGPLWFKTGSRGVDGAVAAVEGRGFTAEDAEDAEVGVCGAGRSRLLGLGGMGIGADRLAPAGLPARARPFHESAIIARRPRPTVPAPVANSGAAFFRPQAKFPY